MYEFLIKKTDIEIRFLEFMKNKFLILLLITYFTVANLCGQGIYRDVPRLDSLIYRLNELSKVNEKNETVQHYAAMFYINAVLHGYKSNEALHYLRLCESKIDSFGYGVGYDWDAFQDGSINSKTTNYSVTITEHMLPLIYGYKNAVVSRNRIYHLVNSFKKIPLADTLDHGICIAYSDNLNDAVGCVHNTNISCANFIEKLRPIYFLDSNLLIIQKKIIEREIYSYNEKDTSYLYWDRDTGICDQNHLANSALQMYNLPNDELKKIAVMLYKKILSKPDKNMSALIGQCALLLIDDAHYEYIYKVLSDLIEKKSDYKDYYSYKFESSQISSNMNYFLCLLREKWISESRY